MSDVMQLFARTTDLIPLEAPILDYLGYFVDDDDTKQFARISPNSKVFDSFKLYLVDIRDNGILNSLSISKEGHVFDGNARYWCQRVLNRPFTPVDLIRYRFKPLFKLLYKKKKVVPPRNYDFRYSKDQKSFFLIK